MKNYSLRSRLIARISLPIIVATLMALTLSYHFAKEEISEVYDAQLVHSAKVLLQLTEHEIIEHEGFHFGLENPDLQHRYERKLGFRIWMGNDLVTSSPNAKEFDHFEAPPGFSNHILGKHEWRFFVFLDPVKKVKIEVSERMDIRSELIVQLMLSLVIPALLFLPVILVIIWVGVRKVLRPVIEISEDVNRRGSDDLSAIRQKKLPQEIAPLVTALNHLFKRLEESFKREREFTDHAAHELRTPLAAMKTQTQVLLKKAKNIPECAEGLENLQSSINRATHMVEQLLALARLQHEELLLEEADLSVLLLESVAEIKSRMDTKNIALTTQIAEACIIKAHADSVGILLGNLLDNAVKYTPEGGAISVSLTQKGLLTIADTGPGLSDDDKAKVFGRFVRADKSGQSGSGLGLSIAQWIAQAHNVAIELQDNKPNGLKITIKWDMLS